MTANYNETGIIEAQELKEILYKPDVKIFDATFVLPTSQENPIESFEKDHIENAQYFDVNTIADTSNPLPHMIPSEDSFARTMSEFGLKNSDTVIIYGQQGMVMGPARAWWLLKLFGHEKVAVLNGGLPAWKALNYPTTDSKTPTPEQTIYQTKLQAECLTTLDQILTNQHANNPKQVLDARPADRFNGKSPEPRAGLNSGHIPGSINIPCSSLVDATGKLKKESELKTILPPPQANMRIITTCGSGVTACMITLAYNAIGNRNVSVYDGSWSEYGQEKLALPIEKT